MITPFSRYRKKLIQSFSSNCNNKRLSTKISIFTTSKKLIKKLILSIIILFYSFIKHILHMTIVYSL